MDDETAEVKIPGNINILITEEKTPALVVCVEPVQMSGDSFTSDTLQLVLKEKNAENWYVDLQQVQLLRTEWRSLKASKTYRIAERRDARIQVRISEDRREAKITIQPPFGGEPVSTEKILEELKKAGVVIGIRESVIPDLAVGGSCEDVLIAEAIPPTPGTDVIFESQIKESGHKGHPAIEENGKIDLHDLGLFISVRADTPLLKRIPPVPGIPGTAVDGSPVPPPKPKDLNLHAGLGTTLHPEDPNLLIARINGLPVVEANSARIINKLEVESVDYKTGNIEFIGSLTIRGGIQSGFKVKAEGDLLAVETVDASDLTAGGSLELLCGVFGRGLSRIKAGGNIKARFLNDCDIYCGGNLEVEDLIANCHVICEGKIEVGQKWGKGQIYGGNILATKGIRAKIMGSVVETNTVVEVSPSPMMASREHEVIKQIAQLEPSYEELVRSMAYFRSTAERRRDPRYERTAKEYAALNEKLELLKKELTELSEKLQIRFDSKIVASQIYPGVTVSIGKKRQFISEPMQDFVFEPAAENENPEDPKNPLPKAREKTG